MAALGLPDDLVPADLVPSAGPALPSDLVPADLAPAAPRAEDRSFLQRNLTDPLGRGVNNAHSAFSVLGNQLGLVSPEDTAATIVQNKADLAQYPMQPNVEQGLKEIMAGTGFWDTAGAIVSNPGTVINTAVESLPQSLATVLSGGAGAVAGVPLGPAGVMGGAMVGAGAGSAAGEFGSTIIDELEAAGVPATKEALAVALNNPQVMEAIRRKAGIRAAIVGAFDAASAGAAGRLMRPVQSMVANRIAGKLAGAGAEATTQGALGAAGEAGAQIATEGSITKPGAVGLEFAAEIPSSAVEVPGHLMARDAAKTLLPPDLQPLEPSYRDENGSNVVTIRPRRDRVEPTFDVQPGGVDAQPRVDMPQPPAGTLAPAQPVVDPGAPAPPSPDPTLVPQTPVAEASPPSPATDQPVAPAPAMEPPAPPSPAPVTGQLTPVQTATAQPSPLSAPTTGQPPPTPMPAPTTGEPTPTPMPAPTTAPAPAPEVPPAPPAAQEEPAPAAPAPPPAVEQPAPAPSAAAQATTPEPAPAVETADKPSRVTTPDGSMSVDTEFQVVDGDTLAAASGDLQPRDRAGRAASDAQIANIAGNLDPSRLIQSTESDRGAPIVDENGVVLSGNGRVAALKRARDTNPEGYARYVAALQKAGYDTNGVKNPVLVRRAKIDEAQKREFAVKSNQGSSAAMSAPEQASVDADLIDNAVLDQLDPDAEAGLLSSSNAAAVRAALSRLPASERGAFVDSSGNLSEQGAQRLSAAIVSRAYGDKAVLNDIVEGKDSPAGIRNTLVGLAPAWAKMRATADASFDITSDLLAAVRAVSKMRREGVKPANFFAQQDAFSRATPRTEKLAGAFYGPGGTRAAAWKDTRDLLRAYAAEAGRQANASGDIFGGAPTTPDTILDGLLSARVAKPTPVQATMSLPPRRARPTSVAAEDRLQDRSFADVSTSRGAAPISEQAFTDAGVNPDVAVNLAPAAQVNILRRLMDQTFGLKIEIAPNANYREAIDQLLDAYRNTRLMLSSLGLPMKALGLENTLTLSLIRQTPKVRYLGVYIPAKHTLALPGRSNSFAHEWMHALDHFLMEKLGPSANLLSLETRGQGIDPTAQPYHQAFIDMMNAIFFDDAKLASTVLQLQVQAASTNPRTGAPTKVAIDAQEQLDRIAAGNYRGVKALSDYYKAARIFQPQTRYWTNPAEMLARAFEAYVGYRTAPENNQFVSKGDEAYLDNADRRLALTFPKAGDRARIFAAFDNLMGVLRDEGTFGGDTSIATAPDLADKLDLNAFLIRRAHTPATLGPWDNMVRDVSGAINTVRRITQGQAPAVMAELKDEMSRNAGGGGPANTRMPLHTRVADGARAMVYTEAGVMSVVVKRNKGKGGEFLDAVRKMFFRDPGTGQLQTELWQRAVNARINLRMARVGAALEIANVPELVPFFASSPGGKAQLAQRDRLYSLLTDGPTKTPGATPEEVRAAAALRREMDDVHREGTAIGLDMGYVRDGGYLKRIINMGAVFNDPVGFEDKARQVYEIQFDKAYAADPTSLEDFRKYVRGADPEFHQQTIKPILKQITAAQKANDAALVQQLTDRLADVVKTRYAQIAAQKYQERITIGDAHSFDGAVGPDASALGERALPAEASAILKDFYVSDPVTAVRSYIQQMTRLIEYRKRLGKPGAEGDLNVVLRRDENLQAAVAKAGLSTYSTADRVKIITTLTDPARVDRLQMLMTEAGRAGANPEDIARVRDSVEFMTGRTRDGLIKAQANVSEAFYVFGTLALLGRVAWTALSEPLTAVGRLQSFKAAGLSMATYLRLMVDQNAGDIQNLRAVAELIGIVTSPFNEQAVQSIMDYQHADTPGTARLMASYMHANLQTPLTNIQRISTMRAMHWYLGKTLTEALDKSDPVQQERARAELREYGIAANEQIQEMWDWFYDLNGNFPTPEQILSAGKVGQVWAEIQREGVFSTVQEPDRGTKPRFASHRWGRLAFGLTSFSYTFFRNFHQRALNRTIRDTEIRRLAGQSYPEALGKSALQNGGWLASGFAALFVAQFLTTVLREAIMNGDEWERRAREGKLMDWLTGLALSRTGVFGPFDVIVQAVSGVKYQRDLTALTAGPYVSLPLSFLQSMANATFNNSAKTNNAEYAAYKDAYRFFAAPMWSALIAAAPGSPWWKAPAIQMLSSNKAADKFATTIVGEKDATVRRREREERRASETPLERMRRERREQRAREKP